MNAKSIHYALVALITVIGLPTGAIAPPVKAQVKKTPPPSQTLEALFKAAEQGDAVRVRALLDQGIDVNAPNEAGSTVLMAAVGVGSRFRENRADHSEVVKLLLSRGAAVNATDKQRQTALMKALEGVASESGIISPAPAIVRLLVEQGADVNAKD